MTKLNLSTLEKVERAVEYCLLSYSDTFANAHIKSDSDNSDFWIWEFRDTFKEFHLCIRGTDDLEDIKKDLAIYPKKINGVGYACAGFANSAFHILGFILPQIINASQNNYTIVISGHSYGGSVAQVIQQILSHKHNVKSECITFGSSRTWFPFAQLTGEHIRVNIDDDPVTKLPFLGYLVGVYKHRETIDFFIHTTGWLDIADHKIKKYKNVITNKVLNEQTRLQMQKIQSPRTGDTYYLRGTRGA